MKNKDFFYQQYNKINWENQEKTKINYLVNSYIINKIISKKQGSEIKLFDMGFGIGFFFKMLYSSLTKKYSEIILEGCEPSIKNYKFSMKNLQKLKKILKIYNKTFLEAESKEKFDFITSIYVFPHFTSDEMEYVVKKSYSLLEENGKFILVVANEKYLEKKLKEKKDLFIEENVIHFNGSNYKEILHYSDIPHIGKIIDYNREEKFYLDLFKNNRFKLIQKKDLNDNGFICTVFVFEKEAKMRIR